MRGALHDCGFHHAHRKLRVVFVAVKEVLKVDQNLTTMTIQEINGIRNHQHAFVKRCLQSISDVIIPGLCNDAHGRCIRVKQIAKSGIIVDFPFRATGGAESHKS